MSAGEIAGEAVEQAMTSGGGMGCVAKIAILLVVLVMGYLALFASPAPSTHAVEKHGEGVMDAFACREAGGVVAHMVNPETGRTADICRVGADWWTIIDNAEGCNITCICKEKMTFLCQVIRWLSNGGYH